MVVEMCRSNTHFRAQEEVRILCGNSTLKLIVKNKSLSRSVRWNAEDVNLWNMIFEFSHYSCKTPATGEWNCKGAESGTKFKKIEFDDGEWHDYDEKSGLPTEIVRAK
ncbi:hypothetical protein PSTT_16392 [Puccinia striiformis]|uniref:Uncharacterized protein n=1 Tax=Puccinia striiformis TaxID=27350 RepID=A0A2S4UDG2_9BASI|nr:hypothetical protein PSTT_16392 [Puccinia striiformis]